MSAIAEIASAIPVRPDEAKHANDPTEEVAQSDAVFVEASATRPIDALPIAILTRDGDADSDAKSTNDDIGDERQGDSSFPVAWPIVVAEKSRSPLQTSRGGLVMPPTHTSCVDNKGIKIVKVRRDRLRESRESVNVEIRRKWEKFGRAAIDKELSDVTIKSQDDMYLNEPNANVDLQDEEVSKSLVGNQNAFWTRQRQQIERKYVVDSKDGIGEAPVANRHAAANDSFLRMLQVDCTGGAISDRDEVILKDPATSSHTADNNAFVSIVQAGAFNDIDISASNDAFLQMIQGGDGGRGDDYDEYGSNGHHNERGDCHVVESIGNDDDYIKECWNFAEGRGTADKASFEKRHAATNDVFMSMIQSGGGGAGVASDADRSDRDGGGIRSEDHHAAANDSFLRMLRGDWHAVESDDDNSKEGRGSVEGRGTANKASFENRHAAANDAFLSMIQGGGGGAEAAEAANESDRDGSGPLSEDHHAAANNSFLRMLRANVGATGGTFHDRDEGEPESPAGNRLTADDDSFLSMIQAGVASGGGTKGEEEGGDDYSGGMRDPGVLSTPNVTASISGVSIGNHAAMNMINAFGNYASGPAGSRQKWMTAPTSALACICEGDAEEETMPKACDKVPNGESSLTRLVDIGEDGSLASQKENADPTGIYLPKGFAKRSGVKQVRVPKFINKIPSAGKRGGKETQKATFVENKVPQSDEEIESAGTAFLDVIGKNLGLGASKDMGGAKKRVGFARHRKNRGRCNIDWTLPPTDPSLESEQQLEHVHSCGSQRTYEWDRDRNTIVVSNISVGTTEKDLRDLFQPFGRISRVYLAKDEETMILQRSAFVSFVHREDAALAMENLQGFRHDHFVLQLEWGPKDPAREGMQFRSGYGKILAPEDLERSVSEEAEERIFRIGAAVYCVTVPDRTWPGETFPARVGTRILMVRCPLNARPGARLQIIIQDEDPLSPSRPPSSLSAEAAADEVGPLKTKMLVFQAVVPRSARPGQTFRAKVEGKNVLVPCPINAYPGSTVLFRLPASSLSH